MDLNELLTQTDIGKGLMINLTTLKEFAMVKLEEIELLFPEFPKHNIEHSEKVIENLNKIIYDNLKKDLNEYEIYFLLAAAYLHDIGMALLEEELDDPLIKQLKNSKEKLKKYIRKNHHIRSEEYINKFYKELSITNHHEAAIIGEISKGHRQLQLSTYDLDFKYKDYSINKALLACFLRIADELDFTFERILVIDDEIYFPDIKISKDIWETHLTIAGVNIDKSDPSVIKCSTKCENHIIHRILKKWEIKINKEINELPKYLQLLRNRLKEIPRRFEMSIQEIGYKPYDFKFTLEGNRVLSFFSNQLYREKDMAIRELLKNSIDTCRYKKEIYRREGRQYIPQISVILSNDKRRLIIEDNGLGMDHFIIENYMTKIGKSYYDELDFLNAKHNFTPMSELGIGILSYFLISDSIVIDTKMSEGEPLKIRIQNTDDYFIVYGGDRIESGTKITLELNPNIKVYPDSNSYYEQYPGGETIDYYFYELLFIQDVIRKYARHIEIPIEVKHNGFAKKIEKIGYPFNYKSDHLCITKIEFDEDFLEGILCIVQPDPNVVLKVNPISKDPKNQRRFLDFMNEYHIFNFDTTISYEGVFVCEMDLNFKEISSKLTKYDLNFKNNSVSLNISRDNFIINEKYIETIGKIESALLHKFPEHIERYKKFLVEKGIKKIENYVRTIFHRLLIYPYENSHKKLIEDYYKFRIVEKGEISFKNYFETINLLEIVKIIDLTNVNIKDDDLIKKMRVQNLLELNYTYLICDYGFLQLHRFLNYKYEHDLFIKVKIEKDEKYIEFVRLKRIEAWLRQNKLYRSKIKEG